MRAGTLIPAVTAASVLPADRWRMGGLAAVWLMAVGCMAGPAAQSDAPPLTPASGGKAVTVRTAPVALNAEDVSQRGVGRFVFAGGVEITLASAERFGGLSDLHVFADGRVMSVTDEGQVLRARLVLDADGRLIGIRDVTLAPLTDREGRPLRAKAVADAEGFSVLGNGDWVVSFEREHRIWRYPEGVGPPMPAPAPGSAASFPSNSGMEALTAVPAMGAGTYLVGREGGTVWLCALDAACRETSLGPRVPAGFGLTALAVTEQGDTVAILARAFDEEMGVRVIVRLVGRDALDRSDAPLLDELVLAAPLTRDNFEGIAMLGGSGSPTRIYLLSDNNYSASQHTYLLAFDWSPRQGP